METDSNFRFAVIEDVPKQNETIAGFLKKFWPGCHVDQFYRFEDAFQAVSNIEYDVVISDVNLGGGQNTYAGVKIAKALDSRATPLLVVSALPEPAIHSEIFMALGAWDYLAKPIRESEFRKQMDLAIEYRCGQRTGVPALSTESSSQRSPDPNLVIDLSMRVRVLWKGKRVHLSLTQIRLVELLSRKPNEALPYGELFAVIDSGRNRENLRVHVLAIREAFKSVDTAFDRIASVPMFGYVWRVQVGI